MARYFRGVLLFYRESFLVLLCLIAGLAILTSAQPLSQTVALGTPWVTFNCTGSPNDIILTWSIYTPGQMKLFASPNSSFISNPTKYIINNLYGANGPSYQLNITNLSMTDGITVGCDRSSQPNDLYANLVVIAPPISMASPNASTGLVIGSNVTLTCSVNYTAPTLDLTFGTYPLNPNQLPQLSMFFGNTNITSSASGPVIQLIPNTTMHNLTLTYTYFPQLSDNGQNLTCLVTSMSQSYSNYTNSTIYINSPTTTVNVSLINNAVVMPFTGIPCIANGYPFPMVTWVPIYPTTTSMAAAVISGLGSSTLVPFVTGSQSWNCTVTNLSTNTVVFFQTIYFSVSAVPSNVTTVSPGRNNAVALGVGIGVGLGVPLLLGLIVLIIVCCIWRRRRNEEKVKAATKSQAPVNGNQSAAAYARAKSTGTGTGTPTRDSGVSQVQYPNNAFAFDENQPATVRESPGFADLGVRHYSASVSGSVPHALNDSYALSSPHNRSFAYDNPPRSSSAVPPEATPRQYIATEQ